MWWTHPQSTSIKGTWATNISSGTQQDPERSLTWLLQDMLGGQPSTPRIALDVGCGAGQYAELLIPLGFQVKLLDASLQSTAASLWQAGSGRRPI